VIGDRDRRDVERLVDFWTPFAVRLLSEAGVFAAFGTDERSAADVADACAIDAPTLRRFLRALVGARVVERGPEDSYRLTPLGLRLVPGAAGNLAGLANFKAQELHAWADALHSLRTGEAAFPHHYGMPMFAWLAEQPEALAQFNDTMRRRTATMLDAALPAIDWPEAGTVVDIGGGNGLLLERLLVPRAGLTGILFDLPHVVAEAPDRLLAAGIAARVRVIGGSFFDAVPSGGDLYVLSNILHDWDDEQAAAILSRVREAIGPGALVRIFDAVLPDDGTYDLGPLLDLHMLILLGARERTAEAWLSLLEQSGFDLERIVATPALAWVEARPG
jgi:hypothetical protein